MANNLEEVVSQFQEITNEVKADFGKLASEQLNWKPGADSWSVGQCLDHLIKSNEEFFPELDQLAAGTRRNSLWQNWSPLSGIAGAFLVNSLKKDGQKVKTNQKMTPPSDIPNDIVERFELHQQEFIQKIRKTESVDWNRVVLTSPFVKIMTYKMSVGLVALIEHEKRHIRQARRVMETEGFPTARLTQSAEASI